jgi:hypothetical protein
MSSEEEKSKAKAIIVEQNKQFLAQKELIEKQLEFADNIQKESLQTSIDKLNNETKNVKNKKADVVKPAAAAKVNVLNETREMFGINAFNKSMEKYNKKK